MKLTPRNKLSTGEPDAINALAFIDSKSLLVTGSHVLKQLNTDAASLAFDVCNSMTDGEAWLKESCITLE